MSTPKTPEASERPRYGTATEIKPGSRLVTVTNPDGSQTVEGVPVEPKPKPARGAS